MSRHFCYNKTIPRLFCRVNMFEEEKMEFSSIIKKLRIENNLTQQYIADELGITARTWKRNENGSSEPNIDKLLKKAKFFNISVNQLVGYKSSEEKLISLSEHLIPYQVISEQSLSAGYGNGYTDEQETYTVFWDKDVRYDYAAEIEGDSMEPKYHNGDIALIRKTHTNDYDGCVCVIDDIANQRVYIKKIHIEDTYVRLESLNKETYDNGELIYPDILLENNDNLKLIGKVVDSFKPIEIK